MRFRNSFFVKGVFVIFFSYLFIVERGNRVLRGLRIVVCLGGEVGSFWNCVGGRGV